MRCWSTNGKVKIVTNSDEEDYNIFRAWRKRDFGFFVSKLNKSNGDQVYDIPATNISLPIIAIIAEEAAPYDTDSRKYFIAALRCTSDKYQLYGNGENICHIICQKGNITLLRELIESHYDLSQPDVKQNYPLHHVVRCWKGSSYAECLESILNVVSNGVNACNKKGRTALHIAAKQKNEEVINLIIKLKRNYLRLDEVKDKFGRTAREAILSAFPHMGNILPTKQCYNSQFHISEMFYLLDQGDEERFCKLLHEESLPINFFKQTNGYYTLLQYACRLQLYLSVDKLLSKGADVNYFMNDEPPVNLAVIQLDYRILKRLLEKNPTLCHLTWEGKTILHTILNYSFRQSPNLLPCLQLLLNYIKSTSFDINAQDNEGNTPLHFIKGHAEVVGEMLKHGASVFIKNNNGEVPLKLIDPKVFKEYLNSKIVMLKSEEGKEIITFDYRFLSVNHDNDKDDEFYEWTGMEAVNLIDSTPDMKVFLLHPVIESFMYMKWRRLSLILYLNLGLNVLFCILFSVYVVLSHSSSSYCNAYNTSSNTSYNETPKDNDKNISSLQFMILAIVSFFIVREGIQLIISYKSYIASFENCLELIIVVMSSFIVGGCFHDYPNITNVSCRQLHAILILFLWVELLFMLGKLPQYAIQTEILKTVLVNYIRFFALYILLIIGYTLCFYVLFRNDCNDGNPFPDPLSSLFKNIVMLTGEFDTNDIPFMITSGTSHVIFITFVFLIAIVMVNLLNGLAVANTQGIINKASLCSAEARLKLLHSFEKLRGIIPFFIFMIIVNINKYSLRRTSCYKKKRFPVAFLSHLFNDDIKYEPKVGHWMVGGCLRAEISNDEAPIISFNICKDCHDSAKDIMEEHKPFPLKEDKNVVNKIKDLDLRLQNMEELCKNIKHDFDVLKASNKKIEGMLEQILNC